MSAISTLRSLPGGAFLMGSDRFYTEEAPVRRVTVAPFALDLGPVTNRDFLAFVHATGHQTLAERLGGALVFGVHQPGQPPGWAHVEGATWRRPGGPDLGAEPALGCCQSNGNFSPFDAARVGGSKP